MFSLINNLSKKSYVIRVSLRSVRNTFKLIRYKINGLFSNIDNSLIVFCSFNGKSYTCSPKAIYEYLINNNDCESYKYVWLVDNPEEYYFLKKNINTKVVKIDSRESDKYLNSAKYWIFNFRALDHWKLSKKQIYVQCWHGTPLKKLGYDITSTTNSMNSIAEIRNKYKTDAKKYTNLISPCRFATNCFLSAWNLENTAMSSKILEIGYPRNDYIVTHTLSDIEKVKRKLGLLNINKKIILYAPTWRDNQHDSKRGYIYDNPVDFNKLMTALGEEYIILFRSHYFIETCKGYENVSDFVYDVSDIDDINELYIISDILITDYSSVFFDYAILERPIIFYMYDVEDYEKSIRGLYIDIERLPGRIVKSENDLINSIENVYKEFDVDKVKLFNKEFNILNDGKASKRLVDKLFISRKD